MNLMSYRWGEFLTGSILICATLLSFLLIENNGVRLHLASYAGPYVGLVVLAIAMLKVRFLLLNFMELGSAPLKLRVITDFWLFSVFLITASPVFAG